MHGGSTTIVEFTRFIPLMIEALTDRAKEQKPLLIIDNHKAHTSDRVTPLLVEHFDVRFFPSYTPQFNSIETLWGHFKPRFKMMLAENPEVIDQEDLKRLLDMTIASFTHEQIQRLQTANVRYLATLV